MEEQTGLVGPIEALELPQSPRNRSCVRIWSLFIILGLLTLAVQVQTVQPEIPSGARHFYIFRHGEKLVDCRDTKGDRKGQEFANNSPLTERGWEQAEAVAEWLRDKNIGFVLASPFARTQQTALPTARILDLPIHVDYALSEERLADGPYRMYNTKLRPPGVIGRDQGIPYVGFEDELQRRRVPYHSHELWVPEGDAEYYARVTDLAHRYLQMHTGNVAIFTHAMTAWSLTYGLSEPAWNGPEHFHSNTQPIPATGMFHVALDGLSPTFIEGPLNFTQEQYPSECTKAFKPKTVDKFWPVGRK